MDLATSSTPLRSRPARPRLLAQAGFTLLEIVTAVTLVTILASLAIPLYLNYLQKAKAKRAVVEMKYFADAIYLYELEYGVLPATLQDAGLPPESKDPWGNPYQYWPTGGGNPSNGGIPPGHVRKYKNLNPVNADYDLFSKGPDGHSAPPLQSGPGSDDIIRLDSGNFIGMVSDYSLPDSGGGSDGGGGGGNGGGSGGGGGNGKGSGK